MSFGLLPVVGEYAFLLPVLAVCGMLFWYTKARSQAASIAAGARDELRMEIEQCLAVTNADPTNAAAHERLSELYRAGRDLKKSLYHRGEALRLDPSAKNRWTFEEIDQEIKKSAVTQDSPEQ